MNPRVMWAFVAWMIVFVGGSIYCSVTFCPLLSTLDGEFFTEGRVWWIDTELVALCGMFGLDLLKRYLNKEWPFETERI